MVKVVPYKPIEIASTLASHPHFLWLDSADEKHPDAKWSYLMADPVEWIEGRMEDCIPLIRAALSRWGHNNHCVPDAEIPFSGGAAGYFGYDGFGAVGIYTNLYAYNHREQQGYFIGDGVLERSIDEVRDGAELDWVSTVSSKEYQSRVQKVIDYIYAGDIFQANISQRFEADLPPEFDAFIHYLGLRERNPAPFGGYFDAGNLQIASCSPERFLVVTGGRVETKPIKGTSPRSHDPAQDKINAETLLNSIKDRAENIMIVDLLRNDLSKVCEAASVKVEKLCALESFARVHHLVSTVSGTLRQEHDALDLLQACFPGGSITGAPKIRAMEIIAELEDAPRGPYTGALGYIGFDGRMDMNILIRSIVYKDGKASLNVGGGITAQSNPTEEYQETLDKAAGLMGSKRSKAA